MVPNEGRNHRSVRHLHVSELKRLVLGSVTPFLILLTPFAIFVHHQQYGFTRPEIVVVLVAFAAVALMLSGGARWSLRFEIAATAALLTWFADIQLYEPGAKRLVALFLGCAPHCGLCANMRHESFR